MFISGCYAHMHLLLDPFCAIRGGCEGGGVEMLSFELATASAGAKNFWLYRVACSKCKLCLPVSPSFKH